MTDATQDFSAQPTGAGLMRFLDWTLSKGYLKQATGQAMKSACREVLGATQGDGWETSELSSLDLEDVLRRFETLRAMKYSSGSLSSYKSRFQKSVRMFEDFLSDPGGWRPGLKTRARSTGSKPNSERPGAGSSTEPPVSLQPSPARNIITYPFPLRDGVLASLQLPADLTKREAARLAAFVDSLAVEEQSVPRSTPDPGTLQR